MRTKLKNILAGDDKKIVFFLGALLGVIVFIMVYGIKVLNPSYIDWLLEGDSGKHYQGWVYYRNSNWHFPLGLLDGVNGVKTSVIYFDSIPHFALIFKVLSPILPAVFQYFGIYGVVSFALMGGFSSLLLNEFYKKAYLSLIGSIVFIVSPYVLQRMFMHTALAGQWILIIGLYLWLAKPYKHRKIVNIILWSLLMIVVCGIHMYFIPMIMLFLLSCSIEDFVNKENIKFLIVRFTITPIFGLLTIWAYGGFYGQSTYTDSGLGLFVANLNSLINPMGYSSLLPNLVYRDGNNEGFGYLGLGIIASLILVFVYFIAYNKEGKEPLFTQERKILLIVSAIIFIFVSIIPVVYYGDNLLFALPMPGFITQILSVFRASGRFIWGACYIFMLIAMLGIYRIAKDTKGRTIAIIGALVCIQIIDLGGSLLVIHNNAKFSEYLKSPTSLNKSAWDAILNSKSELFYVRDIDGVTIENSFRLNQEAVENGVATSQMLISRCDLTAMQERVDTMRENLLAGNTVDDIVYVFPENCTDYERYPLNYYKLDGYIVGLKKSVAELDNIEGVERINPTPYRTLGPNDIIWFSTDAWNASKYVYSGISGSENEFTWSDGDTVLFAPFRINANESKEKWIVSLEVGGVYNTKQSVIVESNASKVYEADVVGATIIEFPVTEDSNGEVQLSINLPESISPLETGEAADGRDLGLRLIKMTFRKNS